MGGKRARARLFPGALFETARGDNLLYVATRSSWLFPGRIRIEEEEYIGLRLLE